MMDLTIMHKLEGILCWDLKYSLNKIRIFFIVGYNMFCNFKTVNI